MTLLPLAAIGNVPRMQVITISHVAAVTGKTERRVRQVVSQLEIGTLLNGKRVIVLSPSEFNRVKKHFATISKKTSVRA